MSTNGRQENRKVFPTRPAIRGSHGCGYRAVKSSGRIYQGFTRVMTRPACRVKGVSKSRGSGRVGSLRFEISRVGSGRVKRF